MTFSAFNFHYSCPIAFGSGSFPIKAFSMSGRLAVLTLFPVCVVWGTWLNYVATARVEGNCGQNNRRITFLTPARGFYLEGHVFSNHSVELNLDC
ncbi:unnamed protein product, partial [Porites lobata]